VHAITTEARSRAEQLVDTFGGSVMALGLHPANEPGQVEPFEQTWFTQASFFAEQLSQSDPNCPHAAVSAPAKQSPVAVQHPAQLLGPHDFPE
jgi:hypothetical protein